MSLKMIRNCKGSIMVLFAASIISVFGIGSLVVDVGYGRIIQQKLQVTADAAALAAVSEMKNDSLDDSLSKARDYASLNGYVQGENGVNVTVERVPDSVNRLKVNIEVQRPSFFGKVFNAELGKVSATATAEFYAFVDFQVSDSDNYGIIGDDTPILLSCRGRGNPVEWSDLFNSRWLDQQKKTPNPYYDPSGQNYNVIVPDNYSAINSGETLLNVDVFDPDNSNGTEGNGNDNWGDRRLVEQQITMYTLKAPDGTVVAQAKVGRCKTTDGQWTLLNSAQFGSGQDVEWIVGSTFQVDTSVYGTGKYVLNVQPDPDVPDEKGVNNYHLRAGPPGYNFEDKSAELASGRENGTSIGGVGRLTVSRRAIGLAGIYLGVVPEDAAGSNLYIMSWDLDLGSPHLEYVGYDSNDNEIMRQAGNPGGNAQLMTDQITIPSNYTGGDWYAEYTSGHSDTSTWMMYYEGNPQGKEGFSELVE